jgi:hypothetical protein
MFHTVNHRHPRSSLPMTLLESALMNSIGTVLPPFGLSSFPQLISLLVDFGNASSSIQIFFPQPAGPVFWFPRKDFVPHTYPPCCERFFHHKWSKSIYP